MAEPIQARAYADADFRTTDEAFRDRIVRFLNEQRGGVPAPLRILDLGCGPGNISFLLADALPSASVLGIDGAAAMLQLAARRLALEPRRCPRLRFAQVCLPLPVAGSDPLPAALAGGFDLLVSNSVLHHLHDAAVFWAAIRRLAAPGALLMVRDLRRPADQATLQALVHRHAARAPLVLRRDYALSLRAAFRPEEVGRQLEAAALPGLRVAACGDQYLDVWGRLP